jgi:alpha-glucuronidase
MKKRFYLLSFFLLLTCLSVKAEDGHRLWLRYEPIKNNHLYTTYRHTLHQLIFPGTSPILMAAKEELQNGLDGMLNLKQTENNLLVAGQTLVIGTPATSKLIKESDINNLLNKTGKEGYVIKSTQLSGKNCIIIAANTETGVLYGVFNFLKLLQTNKDISRLVVVEWPRITYRVLDHWDNLDRTVERGYAGCSIWNWHKLPGYIDPIYVEYARANASIGINGVVLNSVNANALSLTPEYLVKAAALANTFRAYGIRVYLSARFSAPVEIGGLKTADPFDAQVQKWWKDKADEIYSLIPDFGGFLVKANSEGQPGPQTYGRNHADGANLLATALAPHKGIVMWRAFIYDSNVPDDRAKQAYNEFKPYDGKFNSNVMVQVKNGPVDFQPREPFHPLFGAMPATPLMLEVQLTQEYLGFSTHLVYLAPLIKECLESDTYEKGKGSTVAKIIDGSLEGHNISGIAGVANIGSDINWCGHPFAQANWYAFGRLAWNPELSSASIADDWLRMTFTNDESFVLPIKQLMLNSRENMVNYMTPLGLHHIMGYDHHYGPGPWVDFGARPDWNSTYYHKADSAGIGFDRTSSGSNAVSQYFPPVRDEFENLSTCPLKSLLWFHHVKWDYKLPTGNTLWVEMIHRYYEGADSAKAMQVTWDKINGKIDKVRFGAVKQLLAIQASEAKWWRDACLSYFQTFSKMPIPSNYEQPEHTLAYYKSLQFHSVPGIKGNQ